MTRAPILPHEPQRNETGNVRLPQAQQQRRHREHGNRKHQRAAQLLRTGKDVLHSFPPSSVRTAVADDPSSARLASARQSSKPRVSPARSATSFLRTASGGLLSPGTFSDEQRSATF